MHSNKQCQETVAVSIHGSLLHFLEPVHERSLHSTFVLEGSPFVSSRVPFFLSQCTLIWGIFDILTLWIIQCHKPFFNIFFPYRKFPEPCFNFLPEVPIGDVAGVPLWTLRPSDWEAAGGTGWGAAPEGPGRGPGGVSLCGDVRGVLRGVLGWDVCPPANRASLLLRILNEQI